MTAQVAVKSTSPAPVTIRPISEAEKKVFLDRVAAQKMGEKGDLARGQ